MKKKTILVVAVSLLFFLNSCTNMISELSKKNKETTNQTTTTQQQDNTESQTNTNNQEQKQNNSSEQTETLYTVTLDLNGGEFPSGTSCPLTITGPAGTPLDVPDPQRTNYIFCGWNKIGGSIPDTITKTITYKAYWISITSNPQYIVTYSTEYGTPPSNFIVTEGTTITEQMLPELTFPGKLFDGWYIGNQKILGNDYVINSNTCLTAKWLQGKPTYIVKHWKETLPGNSTNFTLALEDLLEGNAGSFTQAIAKNFYGFTNETITQKLIDIDNTTVVEIFYYRKSFSITIDLSGGTGQNNATGQVVITDKYGTPFNYARPARDGFYFIGWNIKDGTLPETITQNATYTALWSDNGLNFEAELQNNLNINMTYHMQEDSLIVTAEQGFVSPVWKIDSRLINNTTEITTSEAPNILTITDFGLREDGVYVIQITAFKNNIEHSGSITISKD